RPRAGCGRKVMVARGFAPEKRRSAPAEDWMRRGRKSACPRRRVRCCEMKMARVGGQRTVDGMVRVGTWRAQPSGAERDAQHDGNGEKQQSDERAGEKALEDQAGV